MNSAHRLSATAAVALALLLSGGTPPASADPPFTQILDQQQPVFDATANFYAIGGDSSQILAQTVVAGADGILTEVQLPIRCGSGRLIVEIRELSGSEPAERRLRRRSVSARMLPPTDPQVFRSFLFGRSIRLSAGDAYAIVLSNPSGSCGIPSGPIGDSYLPGEAFFEAAPNLPGWVPFSDTEERLDLPFRTFLLVRP
jgi:hypothetical protein